MSPDPGAGRLIPRSPEVRAVLACPLCSDVPFTDEHSDDCPIGQLERLKIDWAELRRDWAGARDEVLEVTLTLAKVQRVIERWKHEGHIKVLHVLTELKQALSG